MSEKHDRYTLRAHVMPAWRGDHGYSCLGFITDESGCRAGSLMLRGPFSDHVQARSCAMEALRAMVAELQESAEEHDVQAR